MSDTNKRRRLNGKQLDHFCEKAAKLKPGLNITAKIREWNTIPDASKRNGQIRAYMYMNGFTESQIRDIEEYAFRFRPPWKLIGKLTLVLLITGVISFAGYRFYQFYNSKRIYTAGNNIPVFSDAAQTSTHEVQLDIYGEGFGDATKKSYSSMLLVDSSGPLIKVKKDNFIDYLFKNSPEGFVKRDDILFTRKEYDQYSILLKALQGDSNLVNVDLKARKIIYNLVNNISALNNSVLADDYPTLKNKSGFAKVLQLSMQDTSYIFLRLKTPAAVRNLTISNTSRNGSSFTDIIANDGRAVTVSGLFKKEEGTMMMPDVIFSPSGPKEWKSLGPPYYIFNPK
jgi:hypothetical protein